MVQAYVEEEDKIAGQCLSEGLIEFMAFEWVFH